MRKKIIALVLALLIICSSCIAMLFASASDKTVDANIVMFENVLENKKWIVESLVDGNFNNNPFTLAIPYADETSLMTEVLTNYKDNTAFKYLVDGMELYKNSNEYIQAGVGELIEMFGNFISNMTDDQLVTFVDSSIKSVAELKYESILNDVFMTDYKSSWNSTLFESNATIEEYRQRAKLLKSLSGYRKALSTGNELLTGDEFFDTKENFTEYVDKFISAYSDNLYTFLTTTPNLSAYKKTLTENEAMTKYITNTAALAFVSFAELKTPRFSSQASGIVSEIFCEYLAPLTSSALKSAGKVIDFGSNVTKYAMLLEALINQNSGTIKSLNRIKNVTSDEDLTKVIDYYTELVKDQSDKDAIAGEFFIDYLANKGIVGKYATKGVWTLYDELSKVRKSCFDADLNVLSSATSEKLVNLGKCVSIGVWLADKATSIVDTSKEIYVCKYTEKILKEAIAAYKADYKAYCKQKTDENAEKCIDDLELLKKLRLYGEKHAYSSMSSQTDSVVGILMGGGDVSGYLKEKYQAQVDALLGCTILPQEATEFTVGKKEELIFMPDVLSNGTVTLEAIYKKSDKSTVIIPEADTIFMSKLTLNGGTLKILSTSGYDFPVFLTSLVTKGEANIEIYNSSFAVGAFNNSGTLNMKLVNPTSSFTVTGSATNSGKLTVEGAGSGIKMYSFSNTGAVNASAATLNISGPLSNSGTITSNVIITADGTKDCFNDSYSEIPSPSVSGNGDISNLTFSSRYKKGIKITGEQRISGYLATGKTRLRTPENLVITGGCVIDGGVLDSGITFRDYTSNSPLVISGTVYIENNVTFNKSVKFNGGLHLTSKCETLTLNGALEVKGDVEYYNCGGFVGYLNYDSYVRITNSYNAGFAETDYLIKAKGASSSIINSYSSVLSRRRSSSNTSRVLTDAQMKTQSSFVDWDFDEIWEMPSTGNNGYPVLRKARSPLYLNVENTVAYSGAKLQLTAYKNGTKTNNVTWECTNGECIVSKDGKVTAIAKISSVKLSYTSYTYNGNTKTPTVTVKDSNGNTLKKDTDYTVKYSSGRKNVGKYTVTVTFKGSYSGTKTLTFKINPKGTSISKLTAGTKKLTATWTKQSTQVSGYQLQYSTSSKMTSAKTKTISGTSKTSLTVSGLKAGTKYYVRIRTYKNVTVDGKVYKYYSSWSSVKNVKTK